MRFLSIQAQDFIEDEKFDGRLDELCRFLSIQAQDFIEDGPEINTNPKLVLIPEHSSSGLH